MKISEQEIRRVAELANLALTEDEIVRMTQDLDGILGHMDKLNELDTSAVEPMSHWRRQTRRSGRQSIGTSSTRQPGCRRSMCNSSSSCRSAFGTTSSALSAASSRIWCGCADDVVAQ